MGAPSPAGGRRQVAGAARDGLQKADLHGDHASRPERVITADDCIHATPRTAALYRSGSGLRCIRTRERRGLSGSLRGRPAESDLTERIDLELGRMNRDASTLP
jgi:hypothetical protein